jgi:hypothetical protein
VRKTAVGPKEVDVGAGVVGPAQHGLGVQSLEASARCLVDEVAELHHDPRPRLQ